MEIFEERWNLGLHLVWRGLKVILDLGQERRTAGATMVIWAIHLPPSVRDRYRNICKTLFLDVCIACNSVFFSVQDAKADRVAPRRFPIKCDIVGDVEVLPSLSWVYVDKRIKGRYARNNGVARTNLHHIVFRANGQNAEVILSNDGDGELGVNCVSLNPYIAE